MRSSTAIAILAGAWAAAILLVDPRAEVPLIDDWVYAASVESLLAGKGLVVSSWSATFPVVQVLWGALFALTDGAFSHTALRLSTLALALAATLAFYELLRALGCGMARAFIGAATWLAYPVAFVLSFTFMTDVPFAALNLVSLWAFVVGLRDGRLQPILLGLAVALAAFFIRPLAIALPGALFVTALVARPLRGRVVLAVLALAAVVAMLVAGMILAANWPDAGEGGVAYHVRRLRWVLAVSPLVYAEALLSMLAHVGLAVTPALVATAPPLRASNGGPVGAWPWRTTAVLLAASVAVSLTAPQAVSALKPGGIWSAQELGAARPLLQGAAPPTALRHLVSVVATVVGLLGAACLLARVGRGLRRGTLRAPPWCCVASFGAGSMALCFGLWFFYDRYYLLLIPVALALSLGDLAGTPARQDQTSAVAAAQTDASEARRRRERVRPERAVAALLLLLALAVLDVTGTRDTLAYGRAVADAVGRLRATGAPHARIDAGYVQNGWRLYIHPENLPAAARPARDVPHVTSAARLPFVVANAPLPGYGVFAQIDVPTYWAQDTRLYVLAEE